MPATSGLFIPSAGVASDFPAVSPRDWDSQVMRTPGARYHVSADILTTSSLPRGFREKVSDAAVNIQSGIPTISVAGLNGKKGFSFTTGPILLTDMGLPGEVGIPDVFTVFCVFQPAAASINGSVFAYWASGFDSATRFFVGSLLHATPQIVVGTNGATQLSWVIGANLTAGAVHRAAVCVNGPEGRIRLYTDKVLRQTATGLTITAKASAVWHLWGTPDSGTCLRGIGGDSVIVPGYDLSEVAGGRFLDALFDAAGAYYA